LQAEQSESGKENRLVAGLTSTRSSEAA